MQLNDLLLKNEHVEWSYTEELNLFEKLVIHKVCYPLLIGIPILIIISLLSLFFNWELLFGFIIAFALLSSLYFLLPEILNYIRIKRRFKLSKMDLRKYNMALYYTNKLLILKSYEIVNIDLKNFPNHQLKKDYFILNHRDIKTIMISSYQDKHTIWISGKSPKKYVKWQNYVSFDIPNTKFKEFFNVLEKYMNLRIYDDSVENVIRYICSNP